MALALLARPEVGTELIPETVQAIAAETKWWQETQQGDEQLLKMLGVQV